MKRSRLAMVALLAVIFPSLSQAADARPIKPGTDIIGGAPADAGEFPFMAAILNERAGGNDYNKQFCGGSLIAARWVLTAAHCVEGTSARDLAVAVGRTLLSSSPAQGFRSAVASVHVHDDYDSVSLSHDAALLHLVDSVPTTTFPPITLAGSGDNALENPPTILTVIGWGTTSARKLTYPNALHEVDVPAVTDSTCQTSYKTALEAATMVCAGAPNIDSCYGDSGGPLFFRNGGSPIQVGIVSWGNGCAKKRFYGVYSEVNNANIRSWITRETGV